jgi:hypothetical protein
MGGAIGRIEILPDPLGLAHHVAEWMTQAALAARGSFRVSLSGGSTPKALYELLASDEFRSRFPWPCVSWYWGDERFVPHDHPDSNYRMTREAMLAKAPVPPENIHAACQSPAVRGRKRCRLHGGLSPGAPHGSKNGNFRSGNWTSEAIEERRWLRSLVHTFAKTGVAE